jgi:hypothetical protein
MKSFLARFGSLVRFVLSGFDRLRLRGESRLLNNPRGVDSYLFQQKVRHTDFPRHAQDLTDQLCQQTEADAKAQGVPLRHLNSPELDKEQAALELAAAAGRTQGRVALLTCVELCSVYRLRKNAAGWVKPAREPGKCLHYYHYFLHAQFGLCYVRVQSWFPFTVRVGLNGRHWLGQQLHGRGVGFQRRGNLLVAVEAPALAQQFLDEQPRADWPALLEGLVQPLQPLWGHLYQTARVPYYWAVEQSAWATDFLFHDPRELARLYARWLRQGVEVLQCKDVLRYLGKKVPAVGYGNLTGEAKIDLRTRPEGTRLKFWYRSNSLKVYDKEGQALRIETTLNRPEGFKAYRSKEGAGPGAAKAWYPLRKGVADLPRRAEIGQAANGRLAESLAAVAVPQTLGELLRPLGRAVVRAGRRVARALNPLADADGALLRALGQGDYLLQGFRNRDLRSALYGAATDPAERARQSARVTRRLALLKAHGLIVAVPRSHRYQLSAAGRRVVTALAAAQASDVSRLLADT